jgi:alpha-galactosidase/6-phospho-beta-glucosidase family protein
MIRIVFLGASINWVPRLLTDLLAVFPEPLDVTFVDIDPTHAEACRAWGEEANRVHGRRDRYAGTLDRRDALKGADAVLITLSTGGFEAMARDLAIPESEGILSTVGDTCGPSGWSRSVRNIPVFETFARDFDEICPRAMIVNYTNPMATLTATLRRRCGNPVVGLCHAYFETRDVLRDIFGLSETHRPEVSVAGVNHFTWVTDFTVEGRPGYPQLERLLAGRSLSAVLPMETRDEMGFSSGHRLCAELFDRFQRLPYPADRHTVEFVPWGIVNRPETRRVQYEARFPYDEIVRYGIRRTEIHHREQYLELSRLKFKSIRDLPPGSPPERSRETGADMIRAYLTGMAVTDAVNDLNAGQVPELPTGACVETLGTVDAQGVHPFPSTPLPPTVVELIRPHALSQLWLVDGMLDHRPEAAFEALEIDPQCRALPPDRLRSLYDRLVEANLDFAPIGFLRRKGAGA